MSGSKLAASARSNRTRSATPSSTARDLATGMKTSADVNADAPDPVSLRPAAQHLPLATGHIELSLSGFEAADLAQKHELLFGVGVEDPVTGLGDLMALQGFQDGPFVGELDETDPLARLSTLANAFRH